MNDFIKGIVFGGGCVAVVLLGLFITLLDNPTFISNSTFMLTYLALAVAGIAGGTGIGVVITLIRNR